MMFRSLRSIVLSAAAWFAFVSAAALPGCTCGSKTSGPAPAVVDAASSADANVDAAAPVDAAIPADASAGEGFARPIAAAHGTGDRIYVAAFSPSKSAVVLSSMKPDGTIEYTIDAIKHATAKGDSELRVFPGADGAAITWRGMVNGKNSRLLAVFGPGGVARGEPLAIGANACATADEVFWVEQPAMGPAKVRARALADLSVRAVATLTRAADPPLLVCSGHQVFALLDSEEETTVTQATAKDGGKATVILTDKDFDDDEREHPLYAFGDELGVLRVGGNGGLAARTFTQGAASPWKKLKHKVDRDDDLVIVEGEPSGALLVYARDDSEQCPNHASGTSVQVLRFDRKSGEETLTTIAPAECGGKQPSMFWLGTRSAAPPLVVWTEIGKKKDPTSAPIAGLSYRPLPAKANAGTADAAAPSSASGHIDQPAEAMVEAGCDAAACYAVALVRDPGSDGKSPAPLKLLRFPEAK